MAEDEESWSGIHRSIAPKLDPIAGEMETLTHRQEAPLGVLHRVRWTDSNGSRKQNFHSHTPFPPLQIATKPLQPLEELESRTGKPVLEVITWISGSAPLKKSSELGSIDLADIAIDEIGETNIFIHSSLLLNAIRSVITYYPDYNFTSEPVSFTEPYPVLMHHLQDLRALHSRTASVSSVQPDKDQEETRYHLQLLLETLESTIQRHLMPAEARISRLKPTITFDTLWYIFKPGVDIYYWAGGENSKDIICTGIVRSIVKKSSDSDTSKPRLIIKAWGVESDGIRIGRTELNLYIDWFEGEREITSLRPHPAAFWDQQDDGERRRAVVSRGHRHYELIRGGPRQMRYDGRFCSGRRETYRGPVIVDLPSALQSQDMDAMASDWTFFDSELAAPNTELHNAAWIGYETAKVELKMSLTEHQAFLLHPMIAGYALNSKGWRILNFEHLSESTFRSTAMKNLVLDESTRNIIHAVCHEQSATWKIDYVQGKGEGQTVLLHGPPGVGKTYTVECISEATRRPLISLTVADIMEDESNIEKELTKWFSLAARWQAILLLDEADIFLERREGGQIKRNGIVSTFLRKMEYFQGLLFLTTNRIGHIDDAFLSRVSVVIHYNKLDKDTRRKIWHGFFRKLETDMQSRERLDDHEHSKRKIEISEDAKLHVLFNPEVEALEWNGREIRNALQTAICLAGYKATKDGKPDDTIIVTPDDFDSVVHLSESFKGYMKSIQNKDEPARARANLDRNDMFGAKK